jgi:hypothetical protein
VGFIGATAVSVELVVAAGVGPPSPAQPGWRAADGGQSIVAPPVHWQPGVGC